MNKTKSIKIKFKGQEFLLIGDLETGGAIATEDQHKNFLPSYAHLGGTNSFVPKGKVYMYGKEIGSIEDIEVEK